MSDFIEFQNVTKEYRSGDHVLKAANNLNFSIDKGEFVVILGPSGSGKSTLLNLLGGLDYATSGRIYVNGENIEDFKEKEMTQYRAKSVGFIFQFYNLIPNLTARENIELINDLGYSKVDGRDILAKVRLRDHAEHFPSELSGGEQQRVSIARAISKAPDILLCDEPTGALDSATGYHVIKLLHDICENENKTVIIVTHNEEFALISDKVIKLKDGKVVDVILNESPKSVDEIEW